MSDRVLVTRPCFNICTMQVCAVNDASDDEILSVCNQENPSGTENGWCEIIRNADEDNLFTTANKLPVPCEKHPRERTHFLVLC